jgi:uncharacterized membrane protein (DUF485 family)
MNNHHDSPSYVQSRNARLGLIFFFAYVLLYGAFVYLSAFHPQVMAIDALAGVNLAVVYGLGLILAAIVLAVIYMFVCRDDTRGEDGA